MNTALLKGDRYSVSPCMDKYPPLDQAVPFDSERAHQEDPDAHIEDPDEYLEAKTRRAFWLAGLDPDDYVREVRGEDPEHQRPPSDDEQPEPENP